MRTRTPTDHPQVTQQIHVSMCFLEMFSCVNCFCRGRRCPFIPPVPSYIPWPWVSGSEENVGMCKMRPTCSSLLIDFIGRWLWSADGTPFSRLWCWRGNGNYESAQSYWHGLDSFFSIAYWFTDAYRPWSKRCYHQQPPNIWHVCIWLRREWCAFCVPWTQNMKSLASIFLIWNRRPMCWCPKAWKSLFWHRCARDRTSCSWTQPEDCVLDLAKQPWWKFASFPRAR